MARSAKRKILLYGFIIGVLALMFFQQGALHVLHHHAAKLPVLVDVFGRFPAAFVQRPVPPFDLPQLAHLGLWGGIWGILIALLVRVTRADNFDIPLGITFGALAITAVEATGLPAQIGLPRLNVADQQALLRAALLNGILGFGTVFLLRPFAVRG